MSTSRLAVCAPVLYDVRVLEQQREIERLKAELKPLRVLRAELMSILNGLYDAWNDETGFVWYDMGKWLFRRGGAYDLGWVEPDEVEIVSTDEDEGVPPSVP